MVWGFIPASWIALAAQAAGLGVVLAIAGPAEAVAQGRATASVVEACLSANRQLALGAPLPRTAVRLKSGEALRIVAILASPAVPGACAEVWRRIGLPGRPEEQRLPGAAAWGGYPGGLTVEKGDPLFPRIAVDRS